MLPAAQQPEHRRPSLLALYGALFGALTFKKWEENCCCRCLTKTRRNTPVINHMRVGCNCYTAARVRRCRKLKRGKHRCVPIDGDRSCFVHTFNFMAQNHVLLYAWHTTGVVWRLFYNSLPAQPPTARVTPGPACQRSPQQHLVLLASAAPCSTWDKRHQILACAWQQAPRRITVVGEKPWEVHLSILAATT